MDNKPNELIPIYIWSSVALSAICAAIVYVYANKETVGFVSRLTEPRSITLLAFSIALAIGAYALNKTK